VVAFPVRAEGQVEGGHGASQGGDGQAQGEHHALDVGAGGAGQVDTNRQQPFDRPGGRVPLAGPAVVMGQGGFDLAGERGFSDATDPVGDQHVAAGAGHVLDVERRVSNPL
jgi:hypothetical protein